MNNNRFTFNKFFWGFLFLLAAAGLILNQLSWWPQIYHFSVFNALLTIFFIWMFLHGVSHKNFFAIIFGLAFIFIEYNHIFSFFPIKSSIILGAALLASIGLTIIFPHSKDFMFNNSDANTKYNDCGKKFFHNTSGNIPYFKNTFGSSIKYVNTDTFENAHIENSFGEMKVYFDNAIIHKGIAEINVENSFGETVLYIPKTWKVEFHTKISFASAHEQGISAAQESPILRIYGDISFGELLVVYI